MFRRRELGDCGRHGYFDLGIIPESFRCVVDHGARGVLHNPVVRPAAGDWP